ncbi:MAG: methyltransferase domain-containing protein, partial [Candidatus Omnitrophota bacterium]
MKNPNEFLSQRQTASRFNIRLKCFVNQYLAYKKSHPKPLKILDIGCGQNSELFQFKSEEDRYHGCDFYEQINTKVDNYHQINLNEDRLTDKYKREEFDVVFCGEVLEHVFSPDSLLDEIKELMHEESIFILSTPNLAYYPNRVLLLFGISPFFMENSSNLKLGRRFKALGQGHLTEGHIRVFTYGALRDLLKIKGFKIKSVTPVPVWDNIIDRAVCKLSKSLSANNVFVLKKYDHKLS